MNYKTTIILILLVAAAGSAGFYYHFAQPKEPASPSAEFFTSELKPDALTVIKVTRGGKSFVLERKSASEEWALPGKWPTRDLEVQELVKAITTIHPRFEPFPLDDKKAILAQDPLVLQVTVAGKKHTITLAEEPGGSNPFIRPTYARLDEQTEVLRLAPGLLASLDHDQEYFRKRRLFDKDRPTGDDAPDKAEQIAAKGVFITRMNPEKTTQLANWSATLVGLGMSPEYGPFIDMCAYLDEIPKDARYGLVRVGDDWEMIEPARDRIDPAKAKILLTGLANLWAESFVDKDRKAEDLGLTKPYMTIDVTRPSGTHLEVQVGDVASFKERFEEKDGPPNKFGMPQKIKVKIVEETRYARLKNHDLFFEIKLDKLDDKVVPMDPNTLRDLQLARFKTDDVRRLEIRGDGQTLVLLKTGEKGKETWKIEPNNLDAEESAVDNLLRELADLRVRGVKDIIESTNLGKFGLDKPAGVVKVWVEETKKAEPAASATAEDKKKKIERSFIFRLGSPANEKDTLFVQMEGWPRINRLQDVDVLKQVQARPTLALAFRKRQLLDVKVDDLASIDIQQAKGRFALKRNDKAWQLTEPVKAELDAKKLGNFPESLTQLGAVEFVADAPSPDDLDKIYGLANPAVKATIHFTAGKPAQTLIVGKAKEAKQAKDEGKKEDLPGEGAKKEEEKQRLYYARLDQGPIFLVRKALHDELSRDSVAYRSNVIWTLKPGEIAQITIKKAAAEEVQLKRENDGWKIEVPFTAVAMSPSVDALAKDLAHLRAAEYVANLAKDLAAFGLDKPYLRVRLDLTSADPMRKGEPKGEHTLLLGKEHAAGRYARLEGSDSVFVVNDGNLLAMLNSPVYDLLNRSLLKVDPAAIESIRVKGKTRETTFSLEKKKDEWQVTDSPAPVYVAAVEPSEDFLRTIADLQAQKIVVRGPKIDWAKYGLDKPTTTIAVTIRKGDKAETHTLTLGSDAGLDQRYARWDEDPAVVVLGQVLLKELGRSYLDFVSIKAPRFRVGEVTGLSRQMPGGDLEIVRKGPTWQLLKPDRLADAETVGAILQRIANLQIQRVAAYPVKDLASFGLDKPVVITLKVDGPEDKTKVHVIKLGSASRERKRPEEPAEGHYALLDKGDAVVVLTPGLTKLLLARAANFTDHNLKNIAAAAVDEVILITPQSSRRVVFKLTDGVWKMTEPIVAAAEAQELSGLVRLLARLRAEEIFAEKFDEKELKALGLDRPRVECRLSGQGKPLLELALGAAENAKDRSPRHFARLIDKDRPVVFVLGAEASAELQEEFRSRKPWSEFDAAQVEKVQVTIGPGKSFTLQNSGKDWILQDKAVQKANPKIVAETLDTLVRLETTRYLADTKANLPLYGLMPPAFKLELDLPTGKRTLLIGRAEGSSQNYYASVAGSDSVFLLSAADARRILRGAAAYTQESSKEEK